MYGCMRACACLACFSHLIARSRGSHQQREHLQTGESHATHIMRASARASSEAVPGAVPAPGPHQGHPVGRTPRKLRDYREASRGSQQVHVLTRVPH
eukprot:1348495-Alexandrium_andersonii.AAC.1